MHALVNNPNYKTNFSDIQFDDEGYLISRYDWSETLASVLAEKEGITHLTEKHWQVINYIRDYFSRLNAMPPPRIVCRHLGFEGHDIKNMFGSCLAVWRIAGLPNPGDEVKAHMH